MTHAQQTKIMLRIAAVAAQLARANAALNAIPQLATPQLTRPTYALAHLATAAIRAHEIGDDLERLARTLTQGANHA